MIIQYSDLMIVNRAIAHDNAPKEKAFFIDSDGNFRRYMKRKTSILPAKVTLKDIEGSATNMLRGLSDSEAKAIRKNYESESNARDRHLKIIIEVVQKYSNYNDLEKYAPALLKLM